MNAVIDRLAPDSDRVVIFVGARLGDEVKKIPGARFDGKAKHWTAPLSWGTCLAARAVFGDGLSVGDELATWAWRRKREIDRVEAIKTGELGAPAVLGVRDERLFPEQVTGATFLVEAGRALLADDMRVGKTVQTITALRVMSGLNEQVLPALVICPNSMKFKWAAEFETWWLGVSVEVVTGTATQRRKALASGAQILVCNWEGLRNHTRLAPYGSVRLTEKQREPKELNGGWVRTVIADEAHRAKDPKSQQTRAWWAVSHEAQYRFALTGTEIANDAGDFWAIGHGYAPEDWPTRTGYISRYTNSGMNFFGGLEVFGLNPATADEFHAIRDPRYLRRTKAGRVQKVYDERPVEMGAKQAKAYDQMAEHMLSALDSGLLVAGDPLSRFGRLFQLAAAMPVLGPDGAEVVALAEPSCKVDALIDVLEEQPGEPLVVFASSRKLIELCAEVLERKKISHGLITGKVTPQQRIETERAFQESEIQVVLGTISATAEGLTLNRADRCVFLQRDGSRVKNRQAEARIDPIGEQEGSPVIIDIVTRGTIEHTIHENLAGKDVRFDEITRDSERLRAALHGREAA